MRFSDNGVTVYGPLEEDAVIAAWPKVEPMMCDALARGGWKLSVEDLIGEIAQGELGVYVVEDDETGELLAALACEIQEHPQVQVFNIAFCAGRDLHRWAHLFGAMEAEAARLGCPIVRITGRPGWGRVFPDYREVHRVFERKVVE